MPCPPETEARFSPNCNKKTQHNAARAISNELLYTGRIRDPETGLQLNRNRFYASHLGRWVNRDPIGYLGGDNNLYGYVAGRPTYYEDPQGTQVLAPAPIIGGGIGGGGAAGVAIAGSGICVTVSVIYVAAECGQRIVRPIVFEWWCDDDAGKPECLCTCIDSTGDRYKNRGIATQTKKGCRASCAAKGMGFTCDK